jgi:alpha-tubulin suppressor-like RCC1 family protein
MPEMVNSNVTSVALAGGHTCATKSDGSAECWGSNTSGELGNGSVGVNSLVPKPVMGLGNAGQIVAGGAVGAGANAGHTCAVDKSGQAFCWGSNVYGQLADGTTVNKPTPAAVNVPFNLSIQEIAAGGSHTCGLVAGGLVYCAGLGASGQLGNNSTASSPSPVPTSLGPNGAKIASGWRHTCAITTGGTLKCWGMNTNGQAVPGNNMNQLTPAEVTLPTIAVDVAGGRLHTCAVLTGGSVFCWGMNASGQLGDGTTNLPVMPVPVKGLGPSGAAAVTAGDGHTCALMKDGTAWCWGQNNTGQLGNGMMGGPGCSGSCELQPVKVQVGTCN